MENKLENRYLHISKINGNDNMLSVSSYDGAFSTFIGNITRDDFCYYCELKADEWAKSELGNFEDFSKKERKTIAGKWLKAKQLCVGSYPYYFNDESVADLFFKSVKDLASKMGVKDYTLTVS